MLDNLEKLLADKIEKQRAHDKNLRAAGTDMSNADRVQHDIATRKTFNASLAADTAYADAIKNAAAWF